VKNSKSLGWMSLYGSKIGDDFGVKIGQGLKQNTALTTLSLGGNPLTDKSKTAIREAWGKRSDNLYI